MPVHHLRTGALYCIVLASAIAGLIFGSELVRWIMAALLALGAVPLWKYDYEYRIRRKEWSAQRLDDAARETEEP